MPSPSLGSKPVTLRNEANSRIAVVRSCSTRLILFSDLNRETARESCPATVQAGPVELTRAKPEGGEAERTIR